MSTDKSSRTPDAPGSQSGVPRKILVAVAEGGLSDAACVLGAQIARVSGAELELVHGLPVPTLPGLRWSEARSAELEVERRKALEAALEAYAKGASGLGVGGTELTSKLRIVAGQPAQVVLDRARGWGADLIVLGTSGKAKELDFGGVARAVLSQSPCPVLLVPRPARPLGKLLVPVDLSPASLVALGIARDWARMLGAKILAVHCFSVPELVAYGIPEAPLAPIDFGLDELRSSTKERFEREMRAFDWRGVPWDARLFDDAPQQTVLEIQDDHDLIVMSTHGHTGLAAALLGSVAYDILRRTHTPALACPVRSR
jgi:nucleotide-binding universal stress UspA family protein